LQGKLVLPIPVHIGHFVCSWDWWIERQVEEGLDDFEIFIPIEARRKLDSEMAQTCMFSHNPLPVVIALLELRRKGQSLTSSHLGLIQLQWKTLSTEDWVTIREA